LALEYWGCLFGQLWPVWWWRERKIYLHADLVGVRLPVWRYAFIHVLGAYPMKEEQLNDLIDEAIKQLSSDDINTGADCLVEIARLYARAGLPQQLFGGIRQHIINEAEKRTDALFIQEKLKLAERNNQNGRIFSTSSSH